MRSFLKFGALSGGGWVLDCCLLLLLSQSLGFSITIANFASSSIAALSVFTISKFLVFQPAGGRAMLKTFVYFLYTCLVIVAASAIIGPVARLAEWAASYLMITLSSGQISFMAKVLITPPQLLANFLMSRYLVEYSLQGKQIV